MNKKSENVKISDGIQLEQKTRKQENKTRKQNHKKNQTKTANTLCNWQVLSYQVLQNCFFFLQVFVEKNIETTEFCTRNTNSELITCTCAIALITFHNTNCMHVAYLQHMWAPWRVCGCGMQRICVRHHCRMCLRIVLFSIIFKKRWKTKCVRWRNEMRFAK